jgi:hypothetical protein
VSTLEAPDADRHRLFNESERNAGMNKTAEPIVSGAPT